MTTQQKLKAVERKIRKLCPELQKLTDGCRIAYILETETERGEYEGTLYSKNKDFLCIKHGDQSVAVYDNYRIIGHDITWDYVALALNKLGEDIMIGVDGGINQYFGQGLDETMVYWEFGKPLHHQKPEVWEFLFNIFNLKNDE